MTKHLFLTGNKQVGKSTLIQNYLSMHPCRVGGFRTVRTKQIFKDAYSVHLIAHTTDFPSMDNFLFCCGTTNDTAIWKRFNQLGCAALANCASYDLILMDELGPAEFEAKAFQTSVFEALDQRTPILGVIQKVDSPFLRYISQHPHVEVMEVTLENRNDVGEEILRHFSSR